MHASRVSHPPRRAKEAYLTRAALEKVLTRCFFHIHSHSFLLLLLLLLLSLLMLPHLPIPYFKVIFMQKLMEFSCPLSLSSLRAHVLFWNIQHLQLLFVPHQQQGLRMVMYVHGNMCPVFGPDCRKLLKTSVGLRG